MRESSRVQLRHRLAYKQAKRTVVIAFLLGLLISVVQVALDFLESEKEFGATTQQVLNVVEQPASQAAYSLDKDVANELLAGLFKYEPVFEGHIISETGESLASIKGGKGQGNLRWLTDFIFGESEVMIISLSVPVPSYDITMLGTEQNVGELKILVDTYPHGKAFLDRAAIILVSGFFRNMFLAAILLAFFHFYLTRPFLTLERNLMDIDPNRPENVQLVCPKGHEKDEFGVLVNRTNEMLETIRENLDTRIERIKENERLEIEIIERKKREEDQQIHRVQLEKNNQELMSTLKQLQETQQQLIAQEKLASLGGLVAGVAHEINTPVGIGITAASHLDVKTQKLGDLYQSKKMKQSDLTGYMKMASEASSSILKNLSRAAELIQSFKMVAVDQSSESHRRFFLKEYIEEVLLSLHPKFRGTNHNIVINCSDSFELDSYPGTFSQIITNLVMNSLIHGFEGIKEGTITFDVTIADNNNMTFLYQDSGVGMSQEQANKIFDPFYTTKRNRGGTGLGGIILFNLVTQNLSGTIECTSILGEGTQFKMQLPLKGGALLRRKPALIGTA